MTTRQLASCELCGEYSADVAAAVAWYALGDRKVQRIDRCTDHAACRARVERKGEEWPLRDEAR
jgi:hypothetical protein